MYKIQELFLQSYDDYCNQYQPSEVQHKAAHSIMRCKTGSLGMLFNSLYQDATIAEVLQSIWKININYCPHCGGNHLNYAGRTYHMRD